MYRAFFITLLLSSHVYAAPCTSINNNSCWSITNDTAQPANMKCTSTNGRDIYRIDYLANSTSTSEQFDRSYADGLGYPEPNITIHCRANYHAQPTNVIDFSFKTISWGDRIEIRITKTQPVVTIRPYW